MRTSFRIFWLFPLFLLGPFSVPPLVAATYFPPPNINTYHPPVDLLAGLHEKIAIMDFQIVRGDPVIGVILADQLRNHFSKDIHFTSIERQMIGLIKKELEFQASGFIDPLSKPKSKTTPVDCIVKGTVTSHGSKYDMIISFFYPDGIQCKFEIQYSNMSISQLFQIHKAVLKDYLEYHLRTIYPRRTLDRISVEGGFVWGYFRDPGPFKSGDGSASIAIGFHVEPYFYLKKVAFSLNLGSYQATLFESESIDGKDFKKNNLINHTHIGFISSYLFRKGDWSLTPGLGLKMHDYFGYEGENRISRISLLSILTAVSLDRNFDIPDKPIFKLRLTSGMDWPLNPTTRFMSPPQFFLGIGFGIGWIKTI